MCVGPIAAPKKASPPPLPPPPQAMTEAKAPKEPKPKDVERRRREERKRMTALQGDRSTMLTGSQGVLTPASTGGTTLLGGGMYS